MVGIFTSLLNNSGFDLTRLPFPPSVMYSRLFGTLHQRPGMNSSMPCHELWAPALCLMTVSINTSLPSSSRSYSKEKKTLITLWHQMLNSRTCMRISRRSLKDIVISPHHLARFKTNAACQVPPSLQLSPTLTHNAPGAQPWLLLFWAHY